MVFTLRDYQAECDGNIAAAHQKHPSVLIELATGLGKTVIFVQVVKRFPGRCLIVCPFISLIDQAADKIHRITGEYPAIEQGTRWSNEDEMMANKYVVASRDSLYSKDKGDIRRYERFKNIGMVVLDVAHLFITKRAKGMVDLQGS